MLNATYLSPPPPFDRFPDFPCVFFEHRGIPHVGRPGGIPDPIIIQIVPTPCNPYAQVFGEGGYRDWSSPEKTLQDLIRWEASGKAVVTHPRRPEARVFGISHGKARFVCGYGMSVYVVREVGLLPDRAVFGGSIQDRMIVALAITVPMPRRDSVAYHLIPAEYLADPDFPGLPAGLSPSEVRHWLADPPLFERCQFQSSVYAGYYPALVHFDISRKEEEEGGSTVCTLTMRGPSYSLVNGLYPSL